jgi:hypothetical protein
MLGSLLHGVYEQNSTRLFLDVSTDKTATLGLSRIAPISSKVFGGNCPFTAFVSFVMEYLGPPNADFTLRFQNTVLIMSL